MEATYSELVTIQGTVNETFFSIPNTNNSNPSLIFQTISSMLTKIENVKEGFYITGIQNLRRKINFIRLNNDFQNGDITEEEYEKELEENEDKYVVNVSFLNNAYYLQILNEIIDKIGGDLTLSDIQEMFSVDISKANNLFRKLN